jgi:hypothetical protein
MCWCVCVKDYDDNPIQSGSHETVDISMITPRLSYVLIRQPIYPVGRTLRLSTYIDIYWDCPCAYKVVPPPVIS